VEIVRLSLQDKENLHFFYACACVYEIFVVNLHAEFGMSKFINIGNTDFASVRLSKLKRTICRVLAGLERRDSIGWR
jgi:hypothetical protein